jgi:hypothetical protein
MKSSMLMLFAALGLALWFAGCKVQNPGSASADSPPTTALTVAPRDSSTVNHYIRLSWAGNDPDGTVQGFRIYIDDVMVVFTTATDSLIAFPASASGVPTPHHFSVQAVDNAGLADPNPPVRFFYTVNWAPIVRVVADGGVVSGDHVGKAFRVTASASDTNFSFIRYSVSLDNQTSWTPASADSVFIMADPVLIADTALFPENVVAISNAGLTAGWHVLYLRAIDAGNAISNVVADSFLVEDGQRPVISEGISATYGAAEFYPDGSVYYSTQSGVVSSLTYSASAEVYKGEINGYRYRMQSAIDPATDFGPWSDWSVWGADPVVEAVDLQPGSYVFQLMARDLANAYSDTASYAIRLVRQTLSDSIIIVSETRDGTGSLGSPRAATVDTFYAHVFAGTKFRIIRYTDPQLVPSQNRAGDYISPYDVRNAGLIVWHSDDKADIRLDPDSVGVRLMRDFLNKGGRVIISGWDVMTHFSGTADDVEFASGSFAAEKLRIFGATRNTAASTRSNIGFDGVNGFTACRIDSTKLPAGFHGGIDRAWTFHTRGEDITIGALAVRDSTTNPLFHATTAYLYDQSFRVAVFGVPLYFCYEEQVRALFWNPTDPVHGIIQRMLQGL